MFAFGFERDINASFCRRVCSTRDSKSPFEAWRYLCGAWGGNGLIFGLIFPLVFLLQALV